MNNLDTPAMIGNFENPLLAHLKREGYPLCLCSFYFWKFYDNLEYTHSSEADLEQRKYGEYNLQILLKKMFAS